MKGDGFVTYHEQLMQQFPVRRTSKQKADFRAWFLQTVKEMGYAAQEENPKGHKNLVLGNPEQARVTLTAHYDTPARAFLANVMFPCSKLHFVLRQVYMIGMMIGLGALVGVPVGLLAGDWYPGFVVGWLVYMGLLMMMLFGPANPNNANDNTSGVAAILETLARIPAEERGKIAAILFDDEEKGLLGAKAYAKAHKAVKEESLIINLDCVGNGDQLLLIASKEARELPQYAALMDCMVSSDGRTVQHLALEKCRVNSDQKNFRQAVAVLACKKGKGGLLYADRIHTIHDTLCDQGNIDHLAAGLEAFVRRI